MKRFKTIQSYLLFILIMSVFLITGCGGGGETGHWLPSSDTTAPTVTFTAPADAATGVAINTKIAATFSEAMDPVTITTTTFTLKQGATAVSGTVTYAGVTATFSPTSNLAYNTTYTATITTGAKDLAGNALAANYTWSFTTGAAPDTTPPTVTFTIPINGATGVAINTKIAATFSEAMDPATITTTTFTLKQGATAVSGTVTYTGVTATFTPTSNLAYNTTYTATITTGAKDLAGNAMASNYVWSFTTGAAPDTTPPTVTFTDPANGTTGVAINKKIAATFSEGMDPLTITNTIFTVAGPGGTSVTGTVILGATTYTATFTPTSSLAYNTTYTATITTGAKDLAGNAMASNYVWSFTTGAVPDTTRPTVILTDPINGATGVAINKKIAATFSEGMDPLTITNTIFTVAGPGGTSVTGTVILGATTYTATFTPTSSLAYNTTYTATITTGAKDLAGNAMASNYVWSFTTGAASDTTRPTVILTVPANGATGVSTKAQIAATFSEAMDPLTISTVTFTVKQGALAWSSTVSYTGATAVFTPFFDFAYNTTYTATITTGATDLAGNQLAGNQAPWPAASDYVWSFTTAAEVVPPPPPPPPPPPASCAGPGPVDMGAATSFGVLVGPAGGATLTITNPTSVTGDVGAASYVPAIGPSTLVGTKYTGVDAPYVAAKADMLIAIGCASARACGVGAAFNFAGAHDFGGDTLDPGVYCVTGGGMSVGSDLTLTQPGVYIFRSTGALTSANDVTVAFGGTANATNTSVFWVPTGAASIGTGNAFLGTIMPDASAAITLGATTTLLGGRVLSNSDVTLDTNAIAIP